MNISNLILVIIYIYAVIDRLYCRIWKRPREGSNIIGNCKDAFLLIFSILYISTFFA